jgi:phosphoribosylanthranilate isomerase
MNSEENKIISNAAFNSRATDSSFRERGGFRLKVCGMTDLNQMHQLGDMGVAFAGLIFYPKSPRFVLKHGLVGGDIKKAKLKVYKVGVFVNATYDEVMNQIDNYGLDMVQLHGNETPYYCDKLADQIQLIKAFRFAEYDHVEWMIKDFYNCCDMFMLDTGTVQQGGSSNWQSGELQYGGSNRVFNWRRLSGLNVGKPFFLSGGIEPTDATAVKQFMQDPVAKDVFAIDINSRFETTPGIKNMSLIKQFMEELK